MLFNTIHDKTQMCVAACLSRCRFSLHASANATKSCTRMAAAAVYDVASTAFNLMNLLKFVCPFVLPSVLATWYVFAMCFVLMTLSILASGWAAVIMFPYFLFVGVLLGWVTVMLVPVVIYMIMRNMAVSWLQRLKWFDVDGR